MTLQLAPARRSAAFLAGLLAVVPAAALVNLAASLLDHPRAYAAPQELCLPLAAGVAAFAVLWAAVWILGHAVCRVIEVEPATFATGAGCLFVALAALAPPVAVLQRDLSGPRAPALTGLVVVALVALVASGIFAAERRRVLGAFSDHGLASVPGLVLVLPLVGLEALAVTWVALYRFPGAPTATLGAIAAGLVVAAGTVLAGSVLATRARPFFVLAPSAALVALLPAALLLARAPHVPAPRPGASPPVVLITIDTLRPDSLRAVETPALDALFADSVVFEGARAAAPWTKPSLASIVTGLSPLVHGTTNRRTALPEQATTLAEHLRAAGYDTAALGLNAHLEPLFRFDQGFRDYRFPARADYGTSLGAKVLARFRAERWPARYPSTEAIADEAIAFLRRHPVDPFFLWVHVLDPHWPYEPPERTVTTNPPRPDASYRWGDPALITDVQAGRQRLGASERDWVRALYQGEIALVDEHVGRILATLRNLSLYDRALIVVASDHGEEFWEHGGYEHGHTLYDEVLRVPLAFKLPRGGAKKRVRSAVSTESVTPTIVDVLELPPGRFSSPSLRPLWQGAAALPWPAPLVATGTYYHGEKRAVLFDGWKYVLDLDTSREELYDLGNDPGERRSQASARPDLLQRAREILDEKVRAGIELRRDLGISDASQVAELDDVTLRRLGELGYAGAQ